MQERVVITNSSFLFFLKIFTNSQKPAYTHLWMTKWLQKRSSMNTKLYLSLALLCSVSVNYPRYKHNGAPKKQVSYAVQSIPEAYELLLETKQYVLKGLLTLDMYAAPSSRFIKETIDPLRAYLKNALSVSNPSHIKKSRLSDKPSYIKVHNELKNIDARLKDLLKTKSSRFNNKLMKLRKDLGGLGRRTHQQLTVMQVKQQVLNELLRLQEISAENIAKIREEVVEKTQAYLEEFVVNKANATAKLRSLKQRLKELEKLAKSKRVDTFNQKLNALIADLEAQVPSLTWLGGFFK